jgi:hypothetical protein
VAQQAQGVRHLHPTQDQGPTRHQGMNVPTFTNAHIHHVFLIA